uniref:Uncharacterized protein n=1 Tax=Cacopsylla melanoneura TaxID=428564 RepID=A0A8D8ZGI0_9HEMI
MNPHTQPNLCETCNTNFNTYEFSTLPWVHFVNTSLDMIKSDLRTSNIQTEYWHDGHPMTWNNQSLSATPSLIGIEPTGPGGMVSNITTLIKGNLSAVNLGNN